MQRKLKRAIRKQLKPLPLERPIDLQARDTNTTAVAVKRLGNSNSKLYFNQRAQAAGVPTGEGILHTNITLRGCTNGEASLCVSATVNFVVSSRSGIIYGRCNGCSYSYDAGTGFAAIAGQAEFTDGTWTFRDIKAKGLRFAQLGLFNGTGVVTTITGNAWY